MPLENLLVVATGMWVLALGEKAPKEVSIDVLKEVKRPFVAVVTTLEDVEKVIRGIGAPTIVMDTLEELGRYRRLFVSIRTIGKYHVIAARLLPPHTHQPLTSYIVVHDCCLIALFPEMDKKLLDYLSEAAHRNKTSYAFFADLIEDSLSSISSRLEKILDTIERLETRIIEQPSYHDVKRVLSEAKGFLQAVRRFRRIVYGYRDIFDRLVAAGINDKNILNVRNYTLRDTRELVEYSISRIHDFLNIYLSIQNMWLSDIMRILTIVSTIFIPITFITGIYGMNFDPNVSRWNMPELKYPYGYPLTLLAMMIIALSMVIYFKRKKWL
jgi:Mg2+ and Co2+ transporter CorA